MKLQVVGWLGIATGSLVINPYSLLNKLHILSRTSSVDFRKGLISTILLSNYTIMNYERLLEKYMKHLVRTEDSVFLELVNTPFSRVNFSAEEIAVLRKLENQLQPIES